MISRTDNTVIMQKFLRKEILIKIKRGKKNDLMENN